MLNQKTSRLVRSRTRLVALILLPLLLASSVSASEPKKDAAADLTLKGGQDGTVFRSLTVEGENRVQIRFERPELELDIDPNQARLHLAIDLQEIVGFPGRSLTIQHAFHQR